MVDEHAQGWPSPRLRPYVAFYSGYRQAGPAPARHRGLPSPFLTLIFTMDDPLVVAVHPDPRQTAGRYDSLAGGLHLTPALITHQRTVAAGAAILREVNNTDCGSHEFSCRDPEGNLWSFGTYLGEPR